MRVIFQWGAIQKQHREVAGQGVLSVSDASSLLDKSLFVASEKEAGWVPSWMWITNTPTNRGNDYSLVTPHVHCWREIKYCQVGPSREKERWKAGKLKTGIMGLSNCVIVPRRKRNIWRPASFHACWHFLSPEELFITHPPRPSEKMTWVKLYWVASRVQAKALGMGITWCSEQYKRDRWFSELLGSPISGTEYRQQQKTCKERKKQPLIFQIPTKRLTHLFLFGNQKNIQVLIHH